MFSVEQLQAMGQKAIKEEIAKILKDKGRLFWLQLSLVFDFTDIETTEKNVLKLFEDSSDEQLLLANLIIAIATQDGRTRETALRMIFDINGNLFNEVPQLNVHERMINRLTEKPEVLDSLSYRIQRTQAKKLVFIIEFGQITPTIDSDTTQAWENFVIIFKYLAEQRTQLGEDRRIDLVINRKNQTGTMTSNYHLEHQVIRELHGQIIYGIKKTVKNDATLYPQITLIKGGSSRATEIFEENWLKSLKVGAQGTHQDFDTVMMPYNQTA